MLNAWPLVLLLAAFLRTAHPNNFTLDTALPWVLSNTGERCEVVQVDGCWDNRRTDRQTNRDFLRLAALLAACPFGAHAHSEQAGCLAPGSAAFSVLKNRSSDQLLIVLSSHFFTLVWKSEFEMYTEVMRINNNLHILILGAWSRVN